MTRRALAFLFLAMGAPRAWAMGERIVAIDISGNTKTNNETVREIARVHVGDSLTDGLVERVKVDLQTCGLFKEVEVKAVPVALGKVRLRIEARDKHSWIIAPTFYTQPGNVGGGLGFGENNLAGRNKKLLLYGQIATADSLFLGGYLDPSINGSRYYWRVDAYLLHTEVTEYDSPDTFLGQPRPFRITTLNYLNGGLLGGMNLVRGWALDGRIRAAYVYYRDAHYDPWYVKALGLPVAAPRPEPDGWDLSTEWRLTHDARARWNGITSGTVAQLAVERSLPPLGSAYDYWLGHLRGAFYKRLFDTHNLSLRTSLTLGWHLPFQQEITAGGVGLRGYKKDQFRGDFRVASNVEYSAQLFWFKSLAFRGLVFWDSTYITFLTNGGNRMRDYLPGQTDDRINRWRNGVGAGLRVYVKSVVLPLLGFDFGYGIEASDYHFYLAVGLTEL